MSQYRIITLLTALLLMLNLQAQTGQQIVDVVYLKTGEKYTGQIVSYEQGVKVVLRQSDGQEVEIPDAGIRKIVQGVALDDEGAEERQGDDKKPVKAKNKGLYNTTFLSFAMGSGGRNNLQLGAGFNNVTGYQFKAFGAGIGFGVDNYARRGETLIPVFAELRGFIPSKNKQGNYYLAATGGYGFAFKRENFGITEAEGGYMLHPSIGYRVASAEGLDVNVDIGIKFQKAKFTRSLFNGDVEIRDILYRRFVVRVGLTLWK